MQARWPAARRALRAAAARGAGAEDDSSTAAGQQAGVLSTLLANLAASLKVRCHLFALMLRHVEGGAKCEFIQYRGGVARY